MTSEKKILAPIRLYDYNQDLSKKWFIYWYEGKKRIQKYKGINIHTTVKARNKAAKKLIAEWEAHRKSNVHGIKGTTYHKQHRAVQRLMTRLMPTWKKKTGQTHESRLNVFWEWNQRREITTERIAEFFAAQAEQGKSQNTRSGYFRTIRQLFPLALGKDILGDIAVKKVKGTPYRYYSRSQVKFLSSRMSQEEPMLWLAVQFIFYCYIRPGELRLLKIGDIIIEDEKICIPKTISKNSKTQYIIIPKAFLPKLADAIDGKNPAHYVLTDSITPLGQNYLKIKHQAFLRKHNMDTQLYKLYSWKHTGAVMAAKSGIHIKQLQLQLRHHSLDQVNDYLRQMGAADMDDFANKMPEI